jgi:hypothetical protein
LSKLSKELLARIAAVKNKRAKIVVDHIVKNGAITTDELKEIGYNHAPRAARDVRELGINLKTTMVKSSSGKRMGAYSFDTEAADAGKLGRKGLPKKVRDKLIVDGGGKCNLDSATHNLQIDHRIPYEVAGETLADEKEPFQVLCGSCNRQKSWECEHCQNWKLDKDVEVCRTCYWASSEKYTHVAMRQERRIDLVWTGDEIREFETLSARAKRNNRSVASEAKVALGKSGK